MCEDTTRIEDLISDDSGRASHEQKSKKDLANSYTKRLFENYDGDVLREILGERYEEWRKEYDDLVGTSDER